jgi:hypothetical protein
MNAQSKLTAIRSKIREANCDGICLQETKKKIVDINFVKSFCLMCFDSFAFIPFVGGSGRRLSFGRAADLVDM